MNYSAILAPTVCIQHEEGCPHALINVLYKQSKDLFNHIFYCSHTCLSMAKITLRVSQRLFNLEKRSSGMTLSPSTST